MHPGCSLPCIFNPLIPNHSATTFIYAFILLHLSCYSLLLCDHDKWCCAISQVCPSEHINTPFFMSLTAPLFSITSKTNSLITFKALHDMALSFCHLLRTFELSLSNSFPLPTDCRKMGQVEYTNLMLSLVMPPICTGKACQAVALSS